MVNIYLPSFLMLLLLGFLHESLYPVEKHGDCKNIQSSPELLGITGGDFFAAEGFKTFRNESIIPAPQL